MPTTRCKRCGEPLVVHPAKILSGKDRGTIYWSVRCANRECPDRPGGEQAADYWPERPEAAKSADSPTVVPW